MKKIMVFGTFDIVHEGHLNFFNQAKKFGDYLTVVVARNKFVQEAKGSSPKNSEKTRVRNVRKSRFVNKAILGSRTYNFFQTIRTHKPDIIALGYDQGPTIKKLNRSLKRHRLRNVEIIRLKPFKQGVYKSSKLLRSSLDT